MRLDLNSKQEISDIEALTRSATGRLLVFGSHSRNSACDAKPKRRRFGSIKTLHEQPITIKRKKTDEKISCDGIFVDEVRNEPLIAAICNLIQDKEDAADVVDRKFREKVISKDVAKAQCNDITPYNAEGAVDIAAVGGTPNLWIGLRSPLLAAHPSQPEQQDLAMAGDGWVWLIAGPSQDLHADDAEPFQLWRFRAADLRRDAIIRPNLVRNDLPTSSEGLALMGERAIVVIDGDEGDDCGAGCGRASRYLVLEPKDDEAGQE